MFFSSLDRHSTYINQGLLQYVCINSIIPVLAQGCVARDWENVSQLQQELACADDQSIQGVVG